MEDVNSGLIKQKEGEQWRDGKRRGKLHWDEVQAAKESEETNYT